MYGGGCTGFQYKFSLEERVSKEDFLIYKKDTRIAIDPISFQYLVGSCIDFKEDLKGSKFFIKNPNAKSTCSCGSSFSV
ncbi:iron-sulfur cluster insertion protein ErpA [bacterium endosymbiont of Pedicinus badii]|uniref:iron-sulfur cluster insertion protein ErpA n=1 Tax=bacterium endosymbiont of Pedicinus badii TaxID=1719126 RepID=UPI001FB466C9|nr:iron-sulfur cluster insertion protein ErpA [bacterium endosymbiont of Pedicinus badii]